ncbi:MAG: PhnD/SsuA/transferrin family substrate-binding protein [Gammaproteobacteria bacterium]|nr:PhnD/SsuA/transferrin family substrate-binding protein [Gammaproteobacteria bacterium]
MKIFLTTCAFLFSINVLDANADINLKFGVYTSDKPTTMVKMFRPILNILEQEMTKTTGDNVKISLHVAKNYDQGINDLVSGKIDFARMGPASFITSKKLNPDLQLLAMESKKGKKVFYGIICVQDQSPITDISQLKGHSFAFGSKRSTIGRYLSQHLLSQQGIFAKDLKTYDYLGRHDRVGTSVGAGQYDAGALKESTFKKLKAKGTNIREIFKFPNVTKPWIANSNMNKDLFLALKQSLLELTDKNALKGLKKQGFLPATDSDYNIIRESMANNAAFFKN